MIKNWGSFRILLESLMQSITCDLINKMYEKLTVDKRLHATDFSNCYMFRPWYGNRGCNTGSVHIPHRPILEHMHWQCWSGQLYPSPRFVDVPTGLKRWVFKMCYIVIRWFKSELPSAAKTNLSRIKTSAANDESDWSCRHLANGFELRGDGVTACRKRVVVWVNRVVVVGRVVNRVVVVVMKRRVVVENGLVTRPAPRFWANVLTKVRRVVVVWGDGALLFAATGAEILFVNRYKLPDVCCSFLTVNCIIILFLRFLCFFTINRYNFRLNGIR